LPSQRKAFAKRWSDLKIPQTKEEHNATRDCRQREFRQHRDLLQAAFCKAP
jgi:hypothetical protein